MWPLRAREVVRAADEELSSFIGHGRQFAPCSGPCATQLIWQTAVDNHRAQAVYERIGATRDDRWLDYQLPVDPG
jgi:hypothetical protein